jgi:hypothetical protein
MAEGGGHDPRSCERTLVYKTSPSYPASTPSAKDGLALPQVTANPSEARPRLEARHPRPKELRAFSF